MPLYAYQCLDCRSREERVAGLDDHTALCVQCRGVMLRGDGDVFAPYFEGRGASRRPGAPSLNLNFYKGFESSAKSHFVILSEPS